MKTFGAFLLLISILAQTTVASAKVDGAPKVCGRWKEGYGLSGIKFHDVRAVSRKTCETACASTKGCEGASFEPTRRRCWMFKNIDEFMPDKNKYSMLLCDGDEGNEEDEVDEAEPLKACGSWNKGYGLSGRKFNDVRARNRKTCKSACMSTKGCEGASFEPTRRRCWMFKNIDEFMPDENKYSMLLCNGDEGNEEDEDGEGGKGNKGNKGGKGCGYFHAQQGLVGTKIRDVQAHSTDGCKSECKNTAHCEGASFEPTRKRCWMYKDIMRSVKDEAKHSIILCEANSGGCGKFRPQHGLEGEKIRDVKVKSTGKCHKTCKATDNCEGASFEPRRKRCWMYKNIKGFDVNMHKTSMILCD